MVIKPDHAEVVDDVLDDSEVNVTDRFGVQGGYYKIWIDSGTLNVTQTRELLERGVYVSGVRHSCGSTEIWFRTFDVITEEREVTRTETVTEINPQ